jgi:hypothetical protein
MSTRFVPALTLIAVALGSCGGETSKPRGEPAADESKPALGVSLNEEERGKLGVALGELAAATFQPTIDGSARIVDAQTVVAAMADLDKATAEARTSDVALKRARDLYRADKTVSAETLEAAERQAATDQAQLGVARAHASLEFGAAPWLNAERREPLLASLARGEMLLLRASFPSGLPAARPANLAVRRLGTQIGEFWITTEIWSGPSDPSVPGPTMLALLTTPTGLSYGERLIASVATGPEVSGSVVPSSAVVLSGGEAWSYVQESDDGLARRRVDLARPVPQGYFQASGFMPGEHVVVAGAGLLLAREIGGGAEAD